MEAVVAGDWAGHVPAIERLVQARLVKARKQGFALTKAGEGRIAELRLAKAEADAMAAKLAGLPDDLDALCALYGQAIDAYDAAVVANDFEAIEAADERRELIIRKANGGTHFGCRVNDRPCEIIRRNRAPAGVAPKWGQDGRFMAEADGLRAIVEYEHGRWAVLADRFNAPFPSSTGFLSLVHFDDSDGDGMTVEAFAAKVIRSSIDYATNKKRNEYAAGRCHPERVYGLEDDGARERGVVLGRDEAARFVQFFASYDEDLRKGGGKRPKTCPRTPHPNHMIARIDGDGLVRVGDFPLTGSYVFAERHGGTNRRIRHVADAEALDAALPAPEARLAISESEGA
jgi:hypothetical protein